MSSELNPKLDRKQSSDTPIISSTQIALLASLGVHLLLYKYGFSTLLVQTKNISGQQTVATIELNALEQARLPDLDPEFVIPEFNNTPLDGAAPPLALPTYINPDIGDLTNLPQIPVPLLPDFENLPSYSTDISLPPIGDLSSFPVPPPLEDLDLESLPEPPLTPLEELPEAPEPLPGAPESPVVTKTPTTSPEKPEEEKPTPEQIAAVNQQQLQGNLRDVSNSLKKQDVGNTDEEARKNYVAWIIKVKEVEPDAIVIEGVYPRNACIRRLEGTIVYGIVVDSSNQIVSLDLLKSASYAVFNQQAPQEIQRYDFGNRTEDTKPYRVTVNYKYNPEICPSLTVPSLRKDNEIETSQPETPEPTPPEPETPKIVTPQTPKPVTPPKPEIPKAITPDNSLREKLRNIPLLDDDVIRERLRNTPLPDKKSSSTPDSFSTPDSSSTPDNSLRERLQNTPLPDDDVIRERLRNAPSPAINN